MRDIKAASFLLFVSLVMLGAVCFVKLQANLYSGIALVMLGILALRVFVKVVAR